MSFNKELLINTLTAGNQTDYQVFASAYTQVATPTLWAVLALVIIILFFVGLTKVGRKDRALLITRSNYIFASLLIILIILIITISGIYFPIIPYLLYNLFGLLG